MTGMRDGNGIENNELVDWQIGRLEDWAAAIARRPFCQGLGRRHDVVVHPEEIRRIVFVLDRRQPIEDVTGDGSKYTGWYDVTPDGQKFLIRR